ncbi:MAG: protein-L-isoaspartate(D-aspartate) O-methyltransferase [Sphingobacteriia bacterium]
MVRTLEKEGITDARVLAALGQVPRHCFVETALAEQSYENIALPIDASQTISQPYTVARQTELLQLPERNPRVLEIGTGSGYQAAVLAQLGATVFSVERLEALHKQARKRLKDLGYRVHQKCGDGSQGWPAYAPYDGIIVTAGAPAIPQSLCEQLEVGGRLVIPVGDRDQQYMTVITRTAPDKWVQKRLQAYQFVPLIGEAGWPRQQ